MKKVFVYTVGALLLLTGTGCAAMYTSGPYRGTVVDADTKEPVVGAVALIVWHKYVPVGAHMPRQFVDATETLTNEKGEFAVPQQTHVVVFGSMDEPGLVIYFPGYSSYSSTAYKNQVYDVQLRKLKTREERVRFADLSVYVSNDVPAAKVPNLIRFLNDERKKLGLVSLGGKEQARLGSKPLTRIVSGTLFMKKEPDL